PRRDHPAALPRHARARALEPARRGWTMKLAWFALVLVSGIAEADDVDPLYPALAALYQDLPKHPELSSKATRTAAELAATLRAAGYTVTEHIGGTGIAGVLKNGSGPTVLVRTDMDALPIQEETGLPYASANAGVMHACGHDVHMTSWVGAATLLAKTKDR